jgi:hypothetical protein
MNRATMALLLVALEGVTAPKVIIETGSPCVFANTEVRRTVELGEEATGHLSWSVDILPTRRPVARRELAIQSRRRIELPLPVPPLKDALCMDVELRVSFEPVAGRQSTANAVLHAMSRQPFVGGEADRVSRSLWVADAAGPLPACLKEIGLVPQVTEDLQRLPADKTGILLVGPGRRLNENRFGSRLADLAAKGWLVVVLEPAAGEMLLPTSERFSMSGASVVTRLDKRLYPQFGAPATGLSLSTWRNAVVLETGAKAASACWAELAYASGGTMVVTTLPIVGAWHEDPTPRYLLRAMLRRRIAPAESPMVPLPEVDKE